MLQVHSQPAPNSMAADSVPSSIDSNQFAVDALSLSKRYGKKLVVADLNLRISRGCVFGLIGPNGAGKSTTLKMLMGMLRIDGGTARVLGHDVSTDFQRVKQRVGYVPETHHIYRWMKIKRVIEFTKSFYANWDDAFCERMLQMMDLDPNNKVRQLSKGMLAKLALLLAVSHKPELLILDEPLSGLDPIVRDEFIDGVLQTICDLETTVILSSHTLDDVQRLADSVGILYGGELLVNRPIDELLATTKRLEIVLQNPELETGDLKWMPESIINQTFNGRKVSLTIGDYTPPMVDRLRSEESIAHVDVKDINLDELFKDYVYGKRRRQMGTDATKPSPFRIEKGAEE